MFFGIKEFLEVGCHQASAAQKLAFCLWCFRVLTSNLDVRWQRIIPDELRQALLQLDQIVVRHVFDTSPPDIRLVASLEQTLNSDWEPDDAWIADQTDEYLKEMTFELIACGISICGFLQTNKDSAVIRCAHAAVALVDAEMHIAGTVDEDDDSKIAWLVTEMKLVWKRLQSAVDQETFDSLIPVIKMGPGF